LRTVRSMFRKSILDNIGERPRRECISMDVMHSFDYYTEKNVRCKVKLVLTGLFRRVIEINPDRQVEQERAEIFGNSDVARFRLVPRHDVRSCLRWISWNFSTPRDFSDIHESPQVERSPSKLEGGHPRNRSGTPKVAGNPTFRSGTRFLGCTPHSGRPEPHSGRPEPHSGRPEPNSGRPEPRSGSGTPPLYQRQINFQFSEIR
jgi:hypothetical protein